MLTFIRKIPLVGTGIDFVLSKGRLVIEYLMIAGLVALCAITTTLWFQKNSIAEKLDRTQDQVVRLRDTVEIQGGTIDTLKELRTTDATALTGLLTDYKSLSKNDATVRDRLRKLEQSNEVVRKYMETPIPVELQCLLNGTCAATSGQSGASSPTRSLTK